MEAELKEPQGEGKTWTRELLPSFSASPPWANPWSFELGFIKEAVFLVPPKASYPFGR